MQNGDGPNRKVGRHYTVEIPPAKTHPSRRQLLAQARSARICVALLFLLSWSSVVPRTAQAASKKHESQSDAKQQMRSLDEQVQEIKSDVLDISAQLNRLEEKLLYPSNTQVALFVSLPKGETFRLDSVRIQIDGEPVAHHIYSFKELEALKKGGVQRIYTGNVSTGEHQLEVSVAGKLPGGSDFSGTQSFSFTKEVEPKLIGLELAGQASGAASIQLGSL